MEDMASRPNDEGSTSSLKLMKRNAALGKRNEGGVQVQDQGTASGLQIVDDDKNLYGGRSEIRKYLEVSCLNFDDDFDQDSSHHLREYSLRQWIIGVAPIISLDTAISAQSSERVAKVIQSALLIALKVTECLIEAEKDEQNGLGNPIPLASITPENILIRARKYQHINGVSDESQEMTEFVWVMSNNGNVAGTGTVMSRLFAVGKLLYELFSTAELILEDDVPSFQTGSLDSMNMFRNEAEGEHPAQKKSQWQSEADSRISNYVTGLESTEIPWSLCTLVKNLLECRHDPVCADDAYASFDDLRVDLQLMVDNPTCFLKDIHVSDYPKLAVPDKLYGREKEVLTLEGLYESHSTSGKITGAIISGGAGAGKSKLAMHMQTVTSQSNGYFLSAKFDHNQMSLKPLSTIANMFDSLCEMVFNDSSNSQLAKIEKKVSNVVGGQSNLLGVAPNLKKLMPSCFYSDEVSNSCVDSAVSLRYQLCEVFRVISTHSKPITIVLDDIQFADRTSLLLVGNLLFSAQGAPIFFVLCHRDDEASMSEQFKSWRKSTTMFALESIKLESVVPEAVNNLISESLRLSPRLTHPLSSILHHKTRGNPLFLRQLLDSLTEQGYIYIDMKRRRWAWGLDEIIKLEISESVLALLMNDIKRLPDDLRCGLQIASCIGSCLTESMINYLSKDLGLNLKEILNQVSQRGFMIDVAGSTMFRFSHDKIQQAAYEMIPKQQQRENHMRLGLALCTQTLDNSVKDEELFFAAVNQINQGGPTAVHEPSQKSVFAELNLKAGRRSIKLSDYNTAFMLFQHGISFLGDDDWMLNYHLSLDLHDAVAEAALILNKLSEVTYYSNLVFSRAVSFDDKLHSLIITAKALGVAHRQEQSIEASIAILAQFGENLPSDIGDGMVRSNIEHMNNMLRSTSDDMICNMKESNDKKMNALIDLYENLAHVLQYSKPCLVGSVSLRIVALTMEIGLSPKSPLAFSHFGGVLSSIGFVNDGCRLGKLALKLVERKGSVQYKSSVICFVYDRILWAIEPLQSLAEVHLLGHKVGQQSGDIVFALKNLALAILTDYFAGQSLDKVKNFVTDFLSKLEIHGLQMFSKNPALLLSQVMVLKEGLHMSSVAHMDNMPREEEIITDARSGPSVFAQVKLHHLTRAFLFRQMEDAFFQSNTFQTDAESLSQLNPHFLFGYFFEGLASFQLARVKCDEESAKWIERGQSVLKNMRRRSEHSLWNWENKVLLLEAESMFTNCEFDRAGSLYHNAILSSHDHKFIHEEAVASELAGMFYYERGLRQQCHSFLVHSVNCYEKWGAHAVARRVEGIIGELFNPGVDQFLPNSDSLENLFASSRGFNRKRHGGAV